MSSSRRAAEGDLIREADLKRTLNQWRSIGLPALRLKCNLYHLTETGKKEEVIHRIYNRMIEIEQERRAKNLQPSNVDPE